MFSIAFLLVSAAAISSAYDGLESEYGVVEYVNILFRHGARTPDSLAPGDPYRDMKYWPEGLGQLTKEGILQHFNLGVWLDRRYRHILPRDRSQVNEAINVFSTDWDRTLMSADAEMSGIFPIVRGDAARWSGLTSYPVPIHSVPPPTDKLLEVTADCKRYAYLVKEFQDSKDYNQILNRYQNMTDHLVRHTGNRFFNLDFYMELYTTYFIEENRDLELPKWVRKVYPWPMVEPTVLSFVVPTWTTDMKRLRGGPFVKEVIENFWNKITMKLDQPNQNISMYSAHDTTISAVLNTMGIFNWKQPPFASMVLFELRKTQSGDRNVLIWYKNSTNDNPWLLKVPGCDAACPLTKLERILKPVIPENWADECNNVPLTTRVDTPGEELHTNSFGRRKNKIYFKKLVEQGEGGAPERINVDDDDKADARQGVPSTTTSATKASNAGRLTFGE
ncbi:acid) phosphatase [Nesidiocoris tenuis]|uniref:acid phosphatase n=1 Tax=Nesidiocoris tenuis TaxID=355587 RepID=A0ABN7AJX3_9HEMI|nr:acid) phosphatase [Nesidiocoris tenuis]